MDNSSSDIDRKILIVDESNKLSADFSASNKRLQEEVAATTQELEKVYAELQNAIEDNQKNINFIEAIYNSVPGLLYLFDNEGKLVRWNKKIEILLGYTADELLNINIIELFKNDIESQKAIKLAMENINRHGYAEVDARLSKKDGSLIPMHFTSTPVNIGGVKYFTGIGVDVSERKKIEEELKANYALVKVAGETAKLGGWSYVIGSEKLDWSDSVRKIHELPEGTTIDVRQAMSFYTPESQNIISKVFNQCLKNSIPYDLELQIITAKGNKIWVRTTGEAVHDEKGHIAKVQGSFQDINERKIINIALNESERKMSTLISNLPGFVYRCANDANWTMYYISDVCEHITGYKPEDFIHNNKLTFNDIIHPDYRKELFKAWDRTLKKNKSFEYEYRIITASGELRWVWEQGQGVYDDNGKMTHLEGFIIDITDRVDAQKALKESESKFKSLFGEMNDIAVFCNMIFDENGNVKNIEIADCNEAFQRIFHVKKEEALGKTPAEVMGLDFLPYYQEIMDAVLNKRTFNFTICLSHIDKEFQATAVPLQRGSLAVIATDITDLKRFSNILIDKNKELENYVYVTSHDLRSPLVNIQGFGSRLKKHTDLIGEIVNSCDLDDEQRAIVKEIIEQKIPNTLDYIFNNVSKMEKMLNGLLQLSRTGRVAMHIHQVNMHELILNVIKSVDYQLHEVSSEIKIGDLPDCFGDENMLNQLFSNIISNAIKYRDSERKLKISIDGVRRYRKVQFRIKDNGIGIAKMHLDKIWQVFFRVDGKQVPGDGIGLSVVKRIVDKHNGTIWVESTENIGSTFFIELPAEEFIE
jgi:PAS domain S-box-containing protein